MTQKKLAPTVPIKRRKRTDVRIQEANPKRRAVLLHPDIHVNVAHAVAEEDDIDPGGDFLEEVLVFPDDGRVLAEGMDQRIVEANYSVLKRFPFKRERRERAVPSGRIASYWR